MIQIHLSTFKATGEVGMFRDLDLCLSKCGAAYASSHLTDLHMDNVSKIMCVCLWRY